MLPIRVIRSGCEVFTPNTEGLGYYYSTDGSVPALYRTKPWAAVVEILSKQNGIQMIYAKQFNRKDWL